MALTKWYIKTKIAEVGKVFYRASYKGDWQNISLDDAMNWCEGNCLDPLKILTTAGGYDGHYDLLKVI